jgi:hypothetical protein
MAEIMYKKCELTKQLEDGVLHQQAWIPAKFAVPCRYLELKNGAGQWEDQWQVESTTPDEREESHVLGRARAQVKHHENDGRY